MCLKKLQPYTGLVTTQLYLGCGQLPTVGNEGLQEPPTKNAIILVVTVTGCGPHPNFIRQNSDLSRLIAPS